MGKNVFLSDELLSSLETLDIFVHNYIGSRNAGKRRSKSFGGVSEFADYREYMPGDDPRRIDWMLAGRTGEYFVRQFLDERKMQVHLMLDASGSMAGEKGRFALRLLAAVGYLAILGMDTVSFRLLKGKECRDLFGVINGRERYLAVLESLGDITFEGETALKEALEADRAPGFDDGLTVIASDFMADDGWKKAVDALKMRRREVALVRVLSQEELSPSYRGRFSLRGAEAGDDAGYPLLVDREAARAYQEALTFLDRDITSFCQSRAIPLILAASHEKVEDVLIRKGYMAELIR